MPQQLLTRFIRPENFQLILKNFPIIVSFVLLILCIHALSQLVWALLEDDESTATTKDTPAIATPDVNNHQAFKQLMDANLFGFTTQKKTTITKVPETRLNFLLKGVLALTPMKNSTAIIASGKSGKEQNYGIGDSLPGDVTIKEIKRDYVILDRRGRSEILRMPKDDSVGEILNVIPYFSDLTPVNDGSPWDNIRNNIMTNPQTLLEYARPVVVKENGKQIGYRLLPQQRGAMLAEIGLEPDDIITSVNGVRLNNPENAEKVLKKLVTDSDVNITVKRGNTEIPINVQLQ